MCRLRHLLAAALLLGSHALARADIPHWTWLFGGNAWVRTIAVDPQSPTTIYIGLSNGGLEVPVQPEAAGIYKTTDGGLAWHAANTGLTDLFVVVLAIDPITPSVVFAGTDGGGVFRSSDGGGSWTAVNTGLEGLEVYALAIDPATPTTIYAGTDDGVSKSIDGGDTWVHQSSGIADEVWSLAIHPGSPSTVYAGTLHGNGVYKTTNGGASWLPLTPLIYHDPATNTDRQSFYVTALAIDPLTPTTIWALTGDNLGVFKSLNGGQAWASISAGLENELPFPYFQSLVLDPAQPSTAYVGSYATGILRTTNGGATWLPIVAGLNANPGTTVSALAVDPQSSTMYAGTSDRALYRLETIPLGLGRFLCYKASGRSGNRTATLADDFHGPTAARVTRPVSFCTPVDMSGLGITDPTTHLTCYRVSTDRPTGVPIFASATDFDTRRHGLQKAETLCLPSEATGPSPLALDEFECYRPTRSEFPPTNVVPPRDVALTGAFGSWHSRWVHVASFCSPVRRDGAVLHEPLAHMACYRFAKGPRGSTVTNPPFEKRTITVRNAFGTETLRLIKPETLCLPALRE